MPGIELKEARMLAERGTRSLGLSVYKRVHAEEFHVVCRAEEVETANLDQSTPRIGRL
jgi:hypothetical protein